MSTAVRERKWCVVVPHHPRGVRQARKRFTDELRDIVPPDLLADAATVVGELMGNAIRHADPLPGGVVRLAWRVYGISSALAIIDLRVTDGGSAKPPLMRRASADEPEGRGLGIVAALSSRWGVERDGLGQCVWAELGTAA